eukprot:TRINITY_DN12360_c0_g1_i1.p2 TRINITY_DN12360_c0_g1~~TRINITY_DN12360_c0_g1_i1.p2  ORF type:complete len:176 (+),score=64.61 TRINITY_DN12360_c0_g1_i1:54-581(+)
MARHGASVGPWVEQVPSKYLQARLVLNNSDLVARRAPWQPPNYLPRVPLAEKWAAEEARKRSEAATRPARLPWEPGPMAEMLADLKRIEQEAAEREAELRRPVVRPPVFGGTRLLTDELSGEADWLREKVPAELLAQRRRLYQRKGWPLEDPSKMDSRLDRMEEILEAGSVKDLL